MIGSIGGIVYLLNLLSSTGYLILDLNLCKSTENSYIEHRRYGFDVINKKMINST